VSNITLIVAPHMDDEVLSAASFLEKNLTSVVIFYHTNKHALIKDDSLQKENDNLIDYLGCIREYSSLDYNDLLDTIPIVNVINEYENLLKKYSPHTIVLPNPSYNQDHRVVYEAALTALRPHDRIPFVKRVLIYEEPETFGTLRKVESFRPIYFRPVDIARKLELISIYKTQIRGHRGFENITAIASVRGMQCNEKYAEAFEIARWVE